MPENAYTRALSKRQPAPAGIKVNAASPDAKKMLAWWSVPQRKETDFLRVDGQLVRYAFHACPQCNTPLTASILKLTAREQAIASVLLEKLTEPEESDEEPSAT